MENWYEKLIVQKEKFGIHEAAVIPVKEIIFSEGVRKLCEQNTCGRFGKTWSCPPGVGTLEECREQIMQYDAMLIYTTKHDLEDSYDWDGMMAGKEVHKKICAQVKVWVKANSSEKLLYLLDGECRLCEKCAYPNQPCRFPEDRDCSIEAFGIEVNRLAESGGIHYINGVNTVTYFSGICFGKNGKINCV